MSLLSLRLDLKKGYNKIELYIKFSALKGSLILIKNASCSLYLENSDELMYSDMYFMDQSVALSPIDSSKKNRILFNVLIDSFYFSTKVDTFKIYPYTYLQKYWTFNLNAHFTDTDLQQPIVITDGNI